MSINITDILRATSTDYNYSTEDNNKPKSHQDESIWDLADEKSDKAENKTAMTVLLEDYAKVQDSYEDGRSCIQKSDTGWGWLPWNSNNVFKSKEAAKSIKTHGSYTQKDMYRQENEYNAGIRYADDSDKKYEAALNFAKADINAIESSYYNLYSGFFKGPDGKMNLTEIKSYTSGMTDFDLEYMLKNFDLDGDEKTLSAEEYASYMVAVDNLQDADGIVCNEEAEAAEDLTQKELKAAAEKIYNAHYKK